MPERCTSLPKAHALPARDVGTGLALLMVVPAMTLFGGCEKPVTEVLQGSRELSQARGRITAQEALVLIHPTVVEVSRTPVLLVVTSGADVTAEGRSATWEFVFHFPTRLVQGVYSLEPVDYEANDSMLRLTFRVSPRRDARSDEAGLPLDFVDSPEAARSLARAGADWVAGDPDMRLGTKRLPTGEVVWATESYGKEFTTALVSPAR